MPLNKETEPNRNVLVEGILLQIKWQIFGIKFRVNKDYTI